MRANSWKLQEIWLESKLGGEILPDSGEPPRSSTVVGLNVPSCQMIQVEFSLASKPLFVQDQ
jgi:hypothetical protein